MKKRKLFKLSYKITIMAICLIVVSASVAGVCATLAGTGVTDAAFDVRIVVIVLLSVIILILVPIIFTRQVLDVPISKLSAAANAIVNGDSGGELKINSKDELGLLSDNFAMLQASIREKQALKQNEIRLAKLNVAIKTEKIGMWEMAFVKDELLNDDSIVIWSDEIRHLLGYEDENDFPNTVASFVKCADPKEWETVRTLLGAHILDTTGKTSYDTEYRLTKKSGEHAFFRASAETIRDEDGNPLYSVGMLVDITQMKTLIHEAERLRAEAESANSAKSEFLSSMSHEIRTPMNTIIGMTAIGKSVNDDEKKAYCFDKIENASKHLLGVINDILDMSKIEAGKLELSYDEFDFENMLQRVINIIAFIADKKKQKLTVHIDKSIPYSLIGDNQRLAQIVTNLLSNAVKFTPEGGFVKLDTILVGEENGEYTIKVTVKDNGIGISKEKHKYIFNSFYQAETGISHKFGGTGLGLVISKNIVELMGGQIWLESELGKGSEFSFTFKAKRGTKKIKTLSELGVNWDNISVMVVDDDKETLDYFKEIMQGLGADCDTASNGKEALDHIANSGMHHIFFIDWKMPGMDGIELARAIKEKTKFPNDTVIIMISAAEWSNISDEAKKAGVDGFLSKPLFPSAILNAIIEEIGLSTKGIAEQADDLHGSFKGKRILLADDLEINREIVIALLEPTGVEIDCAENGIEAVQTFEESDYDLILMDVHMPEMDGYMATQKIRESKRKTAKTIPIIAITADVFRGDIEKCLEAKMNDHIGKPINVDDLMGILKKYLLSR